MAVGLGVLKGMSITFRHFVQSYLSGRKEQPVLAGDLPHEVSVAGLRGGMPTGTSGLITIQYPEQKLPVPERFRYLPFLVYNEDPQDPRAQFDGVRCTACGICSKVCPPQCIWIRQAKGADGKARAVPAQFTIDASICMSCGFCAEFCPFDAIRMDHEFEMSSYERRHSWVLTLQELLHPESYHAAIHPAGYREEVEARRAKEAAKAAAQAAAKAAAEARQAEPSGSSAAGA